MSDVTQQGNGGVPAEIDTGFGDALMRGIENIQPTAGGSGGLPFMKLHKNSGVFLYGQTDEEVQDGSQWAVNARSLKHGWCCWKEGSLIGEVMDSVMVPMRPCPPPIHGQAFQQQYSMEMVCLNGEDEGVATLYKNNSYGFRQAFEKLVRSDMRSRYEIDKRFFWPIITLHSESYEHKSYGEIFNPIFRIVAWADENGVIAGKPAAAVAGPVQAAKPAEPPKPARKRKPPLEASPAPEVAVQREEPQPTQQARRVPPAPSSAQVEAAEEPARVFTGQRRRPAAR